MGYSKPDYHVVENSDWVDLTTVTGYQNIANVPITIQAKFVEAIYVFVGGATKPADKNDGMLLLTEASISETSDHWWVRGKGRISILVSQ